MRLSMVIALTAGVLSVTVAAVSSAYHPGHTDTPRFVTEPPAFVPDTSTTVGALEQSDSLAGGHQDAGKAESDVGAGAPRAVAASVPTAPDAVIALTNDERLKAGCGRLKPDGELARAGLLHASDMVRRGYFDHISPEGITPLDRARAQGFAGGVGENLAAGYPTAADVVEGWMQSPHHRANILNCDFSRIGVAHLDAMIPGQQASGVWVQEFGSED
jgi:uncharacterized protein YkwD